MHAPSSESEVRSPLSFGLRRLPGAAADIDGNCFCWVCGRKAIWHLL